MGILAYKNLFAMEMILSMFKVYWAYSIQRSEVVEYCRSKSELNRWSDKDIFCDGLKADISDEDVSDYDVLLCMNEIFDLLMKYASEKGEAYVKAGLYAYGLDRFLQCSEDIIFYEDQSLYSLAIEQLNETVDPMDDFYSSENICKRIEFLESSGCKETPWGVLSIR